MKSSSRGLSKAVSGSEKSSRLAKWTSISVNGFNHDLALVDFSSTRGNSIADGFLNAQRMPLAHDTYNFGSRMPSQRQFHDVVENRKLATGVSADILVARDAAWHRSHHQTFQAE